MSNDLVSQFTHFGRKYDGNVENPVFSIENPHEGYNLHVSKFRAATRIQFLLLKNSQKISNRIYLTLTELAKILNHLHKVVFRILLKTSKPLNFSFPIMYSVRFRLRLKYMHCNHHQTLFFITFCFKYHLSNVHIDFDHCQVYTHSFELQAIGSNYVQGEFQ